MLLPLNSTMIGSAPPCIAKSLDVDVSLGAWLIIACLLATVIAQPTLGKLGNRVGHRPMFIAFRCGAHAEQRRAAAQSVRIADWPAIFYIKVPVSRAAVALTLYAIPARLPNAPITRRQFDVWGATALGHALLGLLLDLLLGPRNGWATPKVIGSFVVSIICAVLSVMQERRQPEPVVHLQFFRNLH